MTCRELRLWSDILRTLREGQGHGWRASGGSGDKRTPEEVTDKARPIRFVARVREWRGCLARKLRNLDDFGLVLMGTDSRGHALDSRTCSATGAPSRLDWHSIRNAGMSSQLQRYLRLCTTAVVKSTFQFGVLGISPRMSSRELSFRFFLD